MNMQVVRDWPAVLDVDMAVSYSGLAPAEISRAAREGQLSFKPLGPRGRKVVLRTQIDALIAMLFNDNVSVLLEDMDFG